VDSCLIIASDGLWDVVSNEEAVKTVQGCVCPVEAAKKLVRIARLKDTHDNVTAVVVKFSYAGVGLTSKK
jgi:protein phosphatase PTC1